MKTLTYTNIYSHFTYNDICALTEKFWTNKVTIFNHSKIWLTITVTNTNNTSFVLLKKLPFHTNEYEDLLLVIKEIFNSALLRNRKDIIEEISFTYSINIVPKEKYNYKSIIFFIVSSSLITSLLVLSILLYIDILSLDMLYQNTQVPTITDSIKNIDISTIGDRIESTDLISQSANAKEIKIKHNIFSSFLDLFNKSNNRYFPSYFVPTKLMFSIEKESCDPYLVDFIFYNHFIILDHYHNTVTEHINGLTNASANQYISEIEMYYNNSLRVILDNYTGISQTLNMSTLNEN